MHEHFWVGLAVGPAILVVYIALIAAAIAVRRAWKRLHWRAIERVDLAKNRKRLFLRGQPDPDADKPEYLDAANKVRDALVVSPRLHTVSGFGWIVMLVRDTVRGADRG